MKKSLKPLFIALATVGLVACSSSSDSDSASDSSADAPTESTVAEAAGNETATKGDAFCLAAAEAKAASQAEMDTAPEAMKANFAEITRLNTVALEAAPEDIKDALVTMLSAFDALNAVLAENNYDVNAPDVVAAATNAGAPGSPEAAASTEVDDYLVTNCDIPKD